jgi:hypothetical protein
VAQPIDESKFASLSANMLVRKGDAEPSEIRRARRQKSGTTQERNSGGRDAADPAHIDETELLPPFGVFDHTIHQSGQKKQHRIMIVLTEEEHETLGIVAVKKGFTRHQVLRKALDGYLEWLVDEYGGRCRCVASTCSKDCDHLSAAEESERPTDVE